MSMRMVWGIINMTLGQMKEEIIQTMADAAIKAVKNCQDHTWPTVIAEQIFNDLCRKGYYIRIEEE